MKPRFEPVSSKAVELLKAAKDLEDRIAKKEAGSMPDYGGQKEGSDVGHARFEIQPSKAPNAFYNTNNTLPAVEDVANKGAISENSDVTTRDSPYYPTAFSTTGALENFTGDKGTPIQKSLGGSAERMAVQDLQKSVDRLASRLK